MQHQQWFLLLFCIFTGNASQEVWKMTLLAMSKFSASLLYAMILCIILHRIANQESCVWSLTQRVQIFRGWSIWWEHVWDVILDKVHNNIHLYDYLADDDYNPENIKTDGTYPEEFTWTYNDLPTGRIHEDHYNYSGPGPFLSHTCQQSSILF